MRGGEGRRGKERGKGWGGGSVPDHNSIISKGKHISPATETWSIYSMHSHDPEATAPILICFSALDVTDVLHLNT